MLRENDDYKRILADYVVVHMFREKDREAFEAWSKRYKTPVMAIPQINIVKSDGKLLYTGAPRNPKELLEYKTKELNGDPEVPKLIAEYKAALKEADRLVAAGKFVTAYAQLTPFPEGMTFDAKTAGQNRATIKRIDDAALAQLAEAKRLVDKGASESARLDGAYQIMTIRSGLVRREAVRKKAIALVAEIRNVSDANGDLLSQASWLSVAREAVRAEDFVKARKSYEQVVNKHPGTEGAKRAQAALAELDKK